MKSAYELAMERLEKESGPTRKLTDEQKAQVAEIDRLYDAKAAEAKITYEQKIASAANPEELERIQAELASTLTSLEERREREKNAIWNRT